MVMPMKNGPENAPDNMKSPRRKRRTRKDIIDRICDAARTLFAERGYAGTTTKEIAKLADVSETLLFRHFGDKARLFDEVVSAPFNSIMKEFVAHHPDLSDGSAREVDARRMVGQVFALFSQNRQMFAALMAGGTDPLSDSHAATSHGLDHFFNQSVAQLELMYAAKNDDPEFDLQIGTRLGFGMIAAGVLLREWLFPENSPSDQAIITVLEKMVERALNPVRND